jgi:cysteine desulfurase
MKAPVYFDYAAATPVDQRVVEAMLPFYSEQFYNPSATYLAARGVSQDLAKARAAVAGILGVRPAEIIFSAGGTEANNLAIRGVMEQFPGANVLVSAIEHESVLAPAEAYDCRVAKVAADGTIDLPALEAAIDENTVLVSVMYANNEVGTIEPLRDVAEIVAKKRAERQGTHALPL